MMLEGLLGVGNKLLDAFLPKNMSEEKKSQFRIKFAELASKEVSKEVEDRVSARLLAQKELARGNSLTNLLAAVHRPIWSLVTLSIFIYSAIGVSLGGPEVLLTPLHKSIMQTVVIFYFGGRSIEKIFNKEKH